MQAILYALPETDILGDMGVFMAHHQTPSMAAEFNIRKIVLENRQKAVAEYLIALACFYCP